MPGITRNPNRGVELGYVEKTDADFTTTSTAASGADITGMSVTVTVGQRPIVVLAGGPYFAASTNASQIPAVYMLQGTTKIQSTQGFANAVFEEFPLAMRCRLSLAPGSYTFKLAAGNAGGTGTVSVRAGSGAVLWLQVLEV